MYLSINGDSYKSSIVLCTADNIDGPYTYVDTIVYSGFENNDTFSYKKTDAEKVLGSNRIFLVILTKTENGILTMERMQLIQLYFMMKTEISG